MSIRCEITNFCPPPNQSCSEYQEHDVRCTKLAVTCAYLVKFVFFLYHGMLDSWGIWDSSEICGTMFDRKNMPLLYISYSAKIGRLRINQCTLQACGPVPFLPFKVTQGHRK